MKTEQICLFSRFKAMLNDNNNKTKNKKLSGEKWVVLPASLYS